MDSSLDTLQQRIGHRFADPALMERALTHRSFGADHNERLEFLGDAVLSLVVSSLLFDRLGNSDEGDLTRVRAHLVREDSLYRAALQLGLPEVLRLGEGEARGGGAMRSSILADALEALIGALYLDGGIDEAVAFVRRAWGDRVSTRDKAPKHPKSQLQEWAAANEKKPPEYRLAGRSGPHHAPTFIVEVEIKGVGSAQAEGSSKQVAETEAAARLLEQLS